MTGQHSTAVLFNNNNSKIQEFGAGAQGGETYTKFNN